MSQFIATVCAASLLPFFVSQPASAQSYHIDLGKAQDQLQSQEGFRIFVEGERFESGAAGSSQENTLENIYISVMSNGAFFSHVHVVLTPNCDSGEPTAPVAQTLSVDLAPVTRTTAQQAATLNGTLMTSYALHGGSVTHCKPQISVVVDGVQQTDPINKTHNFNLLNY